MSLSRKQRAQLAALKETLALTDWSFVRHGLVLLETLEDAELSAHVRQGVSIQAGRLRIEKGYLKRNVCENNLANAALFMAVSAPSTAQHTSLNLSGHTSLSDLSGLSRLSNLTHLEFLFTQVHDLSALRALSNLTTLRFGGKLGWSKRTLTPDLTTLSNLTTLTHLDLLDLTDLQTLGPLKALTSLTHLDLSGCTAVTDLSPLKGLKALTTLNLSGCTAVTDLSPLKGLKALTTLNCWGSGVPIAPDLDQPRDRFGVPIEVGARVLYTNTPHRVSAVITHNQDTTRRVKPKIILDTYIGVEKLHEVVVVSMVGKLSTSTQTVEAMIAGRLIDAADVARADPTPVAQITPEQHAQIAAVRRGERTTLDLRGAPLRDLSLLSDLSNLTALNLSKCLLLTDVSALQKLTALEDLRLSNCKTLASLSLTNLTKLRTLSIAGCKTLASLSLSGCHALKTITGLKPKLTKLRTLSLTHCRSVETLELKQKHLSNLTLADLPALTALSLGSCHVTSLSGLARLPALTHLTLSDQIIHSGPQQPSALTTITMTEASRLYSLRWLSALTDLAVLKISTETYRSNCILSDLSPLKGMPNLTSLSLTGCRTLTSLRPLHGLPKLAQLRLHRCESVTNAEVGKLHATLPDDCTVVKA